MKYLRKFIALALTLAISSQMVTVCAAYSDQQVLNVSDVTIAMIADALTNDPTATNIQISENILTYKMNGTTDVKITETMNSSGVRYIDIIEGKIHNTVSVNVAENSITLDGAPLDIEIIQNTSFIPHRNTMITSGTNWVYSSTRNINIVAEDAIRNLAVNTLLTLMLSAMGGIGVGLTLAQLILGTYQALTSDTVYATRTTYFEENYRAYKYIDRYYSNSARTNLIDSVSTEHWEWRAEQ